MSFALIGTSRIYEGVRSSHVHAASDKGTKKKINRKKKIPDATWIENARLVVSTEVTLLERTKRFMMNDGGTREIYLFSTASSPWPSKGKLQLEQVSFSRGDHVRTIL